MSCYQCKTHDVTIDDVTMTISQSQFHNHNITIASSKWRCPQHIVIITMSQSRSPNHNVISTMSQTQCSNNNIPMSRSQCPKPNVTITHHQASSCHLAHKASSRSQWRHNHNLTITKSPSKYLKDNFTITISQLQSQSIAKLQCQIAISKTQCPNHSAPITMSQSQCQKHKPQSNARCPNHDVPITMPQSQCPNQNAPIRMHALISLNHNMQCNRNLTIAMSQKYVTISNACQNHYYVTIIMSPFFKVIMKISVTMS